MAHEVELADDERIRALVAADVAAVERLLGAELVYVHSNAHTEGKASFLDGLRAGRVRYLGVQRSGATVRTWGEVGLLHARVRSEFEMKGQARTAHSNVVSAWVRRDGRWQMAHYHSTTIPQP